MLKQILQKIKMRREKFKDLEEDEKLNKMLLERKKSANERELERIMEDERQDQIKAALELKRKQQSDEFWHGNNVLRTRNMFEEKGNSILRSPNIFKTKPGFSKPKRSVFFQ